MVTEILKPKVEASGFVDVLAVGLVSGIADIAAAPIVGQGTIWSGLAKGAVGAGVYHMVGNRVGRDIGSGFTVSGARDITQAIILPYVAPMLGGNGGGAKAQGENW